MRRTIYFKEHLYQELQNPKFAQGFLLALMEGEDGLNLEDALKDTIESMGIKEFSKLSGVPSSNIVDFIKGRRKLKPETLDVYLKPFKLKTKITVEKAS